MSICEVCGVEKTDTCHAEYERRIAELEAELEHKCDDCLPKYGAFQERAERAEAALAALKDELRDAVDLLTSRTTRLDEAYAELASLKAQRCEGCGHELQGEVFKSCGCEQSIAYERVTGPEDSCNRWHERGK